MRILKTIIFIAQIVLILSPSIFAQVRVMPGDVKETRRTDGFFNKLEVELRLIGDSMAEAKGIRVILEKAVDETGRDLIDPEKKPAEFEDLSSSFGSRDKIDLEMKNAARQSTVLPEISGKIELFIPRRDPKSMVMLPGALKVTGTPISNPGLKAAGIGLTVWTKEQYEVRRKTEEARIKKEMENRRKNAGSSAEDAADAMVEGLMKIFGGLFNTLTGMGENSVALQVMDKQSKLIAIEFEDAAGKTIQRQSRSTMGPSEDQTQIYDFENKLPADVRIRLYILTPRSIISIPFKLTNIPLP